MSSSTAEAEDSSCNWRSMSSCPAVSESWSSNAPEASSSSIAFARARMFSVLSTARCIAMPTSAISSPTPDAASEIRTEASAAEYCALMTSFLVRNWSIFDRSFCLFVDERLLLGLEFLDLAVERLQFGLGELLALERDAREILAILRQRLPRLRVQLDDLLLELLLLELEALLGRDDVGDALLDVLEQLHLLLVAVLQRLTRILGLVEHPVDLGLDYSGEPSGHAGHGTSLPYGRTCGSPTKRTRRI